MAAFVKLPDLVARDATDSFDFLLTTEPTAPEAGKVSRHGDDRLMSTATSHTDPETTRTSLPCGCGSN